MNYIRWILLCIILGILFSGCGYARCFKVYPKQNFDAIAQLDVYPKVADFSGVRVYPEFPDLSGVKIYPFYYGCLDNKDCKMEIYPKLIECPEED